MSIKTVIFDADDTLFTVSPSITYHYQQVLSSFGFTVKDSIILDAVKNHWIELKPYYENRGGNFLTFPGREFAFWQEFARRIITTCCGLDNPPMPIVMALYERFARGNSRVLFDKVRETLTELSDKKIILGVFTNNDVRINQVLKELNIYHFFNFIESSCSLGIKKPSPLAFNLLQKRYKLEPGQTLYVGNSLDLDIIPAQKAGWKTLLMQFNDNNTFYSLVNDTVNSIS